ncbi:DsbA family protein [Plastoroseomonas arctica]|uniref:Thioredoxin domain-containing protein n=1 Tax=Plastoroseomonas arctica TaxID=1509237 RepID=A0AAF1K093_9PROT|nr:thioredoxin domain-containing protein [Plastoroseomonas arctica]MBR0657565.1 thioredoxin domain-containing protein [Plastoroseomonas arctica]
MPVPRRTLVIAGGVAVAGCLAGWQLWPHQTTAQSSRATTPPGLPAAAPNPTAPPAPGATDPRLGERGAGSPAAPMVVTEFFSLTCSHCAAFHNETWPQVKAQLVEPGRVRMVWRDFPLDQLGLAAAAVGRALPHDRYEGYIGALFATQNRWAFARGIDNKEEVFRIAALAGMARDAFDEAWGSETLQRGILELRLRGEREFNVQATPTFVFGTRSVSGAIAYDRFAQEAAR